MSQGNKIDEYLAQEPNLQPSVVGYFVKGNTVILGLRKKVSNDLGPDLYAGIGGKVESGETPEEAFVRETIEEIGMDEHKNIVFRPIKFDHKGTVTFLFPHKTKWNQIVEIYLCTEWEGTPVETESTIPEIFPVNDLPKNMWIDNKYWVPRVLSGEMVNAIFLYNKDGGIEEYRFEQ